MLPTFRRSAIFVVFIGGFWPVFLNTASGALALDGRHRDSARVLELRGLEYLWRIVLPAALPHVFSGMAVALAPSFILPTVAELFGANDGLGRFEPSTGPSRGAPACAARSDQPRRTARIESEARSNPSRGNDTGSSTVLAPAA